MKNKSTLASGENYFPNDLPPQPFYQRTPRGLEGKIGEKLNHLKELDKKAKNK